MVQITLPDGSQRQYRGRSRSPTSRSRSARAWQGRLGRPRGVRRRRVQLVDTSYRIESDARHAIITAKDADGLDLIRHSGAHLLAYAVSRCSRTRRSPSAP